MFRARYRAGPARRNVGMGRLLRGDGPETSRPRLRCGFMEHLKVTVVPLGVEVAAVEGGQYLATRLVDVSAVGELATGHEGHEFDEMSLQFVPRDEGGVESADTRRVHNVSPEVESDQGCGRGRVSALLGLFAHMGDAKAESGLDGIEQ